MDERAHLPSRREVALEAPPDQMSEGIETVGQVMPLQYLRTPMYLPCRIEQLDVLRKQPVSQFIGMQVAIARLKQRQADLKIEACRFTVILRAESAMRYSISRLAEVIEPIF